MIKVSLIYSKNLCDQTGASAVMRIINDCQPLFRDNGIDLKVFSRELFKNPSKSIGSADKSSVSLKTRITSTLQFLSKDIPLAAYALAYIKSMRPTKHMVAYMNGKVGDDDILFFHELYIAYYYLKKYGKKKHKVVVVIHNDGRDFYLESIRYRHFNNSIYHRKLKGMLNYVLDKADRVGYVSGISVQNFMNLHPDYPKEKLFVAYNGIPSMEKRFSNTKKEGKYKIVCVGTMIISKGQQFIVNAFKKLKDNQLDNSNITCTFVGGGANLTPLTEMVENFNLTDKIKFVGPTNNVAQYLNEADIFILPSTSEGLPMSILEAMSAGLPIVSTRVGGIPETIKEGQSGLIIDASTEGVYDFFINIDKYDWKKMGEESYNYYLEKFTENSMVKSYSEVFKSLNNR